MINSASTLAEVEDEIEALGYPTLTIRRRGLNFEAGNRGVFYIGSTWAEALRAALEAERAAIAEIRARSLGDVEW